MADLPVKKQADQVIRLWVELTLEEQLEETLLYALDRDLKEKRFSRVFCYDDNEDESLCSERVAEYIERHAEEMKKIASDALYKALPRELKLND